MLTVLVVFGILIGYAFAAVLFGVGAYWLVYHQNNYSHRQDRAGAEKERREDASIGGALVGVFWPIGVWVLLALAIVYRGHRRLKDQHQQDRLEVLSSAERDLAVLNAKRELVGLRPLQAPPERATGDVVRRGDYDTRYLD